ncbi:hypothetical protein [Tropicimonas sediminicola]|uniref:Uncharacterized protein n=1 Tax=Tropicimonas sediminicola TaxID=1031541 RepID=A0A239FZE0_9RHOB|nr:hypothetical protein [Tropicimonas sediminicola]SNS61134.1 hypothetical protein SAMN05421757_102863 [Tropicimonas sediminicola]
MTVTEMETCGPLLSEEVNMQGINPATWGASCADTRVTHVAAIDPGFVWGLASMDVTNLVPSTLVIGLGGDGDRMLATDRDRSGLSSHLGNRRLGRFDPACYFNAMPICTPSGEAILAEEKDDPVSTDPAGSDRAAIHAGIIALITKELGL